FKTIIKFSNFLLLLAIILSSFFGLLHTNYGFLPGMMELSGSVGDYLGEVFGRLLGGIGSIIFLTGSFIALIVLTFNIKLDGIVNSLKEIFENKLSGEEEIVEEKNDNFTMNK